MNAITIIRKIILYFQTLLAEKDHNNNDHTLLNLNN